MRIEIRNDSVLLDGYVNAVGRDSKPISTAKGKYIEQIEPRAFERALSRAENVKLMLNHNKEIGSTKEGNVELYEDNIGLRAVATVTDPEVIEKAKQKKLKGWSFGMYVIKDEFEERADGIPRRHVKELDLVEVTIVDDRRSPCYVGTSIEQRADEEVVTEQRGEEFRAITIEENSIDYSEYEDKIKTLKGE